MPITSVRIGNFKGINTPCDLEIRPITVFVGANSSGKSSCIHALAALSQTVKVTNDTRPLVLDDEFAMVHLGRFIEIIHSRSYQDLIELGVGLADVEYESVVAKEDESEDSDDTDDDDPEIEYVKGDAKALYRFKCSKRTQEIHLDSAQYDIGSGQLVARRTPPDVYSLSVPTSRGITKAPLSLDSAFFFDPQFRYRSGVRHEVFVRLLALSSLQQRLKAELVRTLYLGPFRQGPLRRYPTRGAGPTEVGAMGESTVTMLANEIVQYRIRPHITQVAKWLAHLGLAKSLDVSRIGRSDLFDVSMTLEDGKSFPIADLGYGLSQILPVLVQCSFAPKGATLLFEQPEIHLHTIAAKALADVFIETANSKNAHVVIETHSPDLVKALMVRQRQKAISKQKLIIYRVTREHGESVTEALKFDDMGDIYENWEKGISVE